MPDQPYDLYGGAAPAADAGVAAQRQAMIEKISAARQKGASWDQIHTAIGAKIQRAQDAGAQPDQISHALGFNSQQELAAGMQMDMGEHAAAQQPPDFWHAAWGGFSESSTAALLGIKPSNPVVPGTSRPAAIASAVTGALGDLPVAIPSGIVGAIVGVGGGAAAGGGPEDVPADLAGGYIGTTTFAGAGPQLIKSERDRYLAALNSGQVRNGWDFLKIQGSVAVDTAKAALVSAATGAAGKYVSGALGRMGASTAAKVIGTVGAETTTQAVGTAALAGRMPTQEDFIDSAILVGGFHTAHAATPRVLAAIRGRMQNNYRETGETPQEQADRSRADPAFRSQLLGIPAQKPPPASSRTSVDPQRPPVAGLLPGPDTHQPSNDEFVMPRKVSSFDQAVQFTLQQEGSAYVRDANDAGVKFGINAKDNPGIDVKNLSREGAIEIYRRKYWDAIDGDSLPDEAKLAVFDTAVVEGVGRAKAWWAQSNGNVQEFLARRAQWEQGLAAKDPARYGRFVKAWSNRLRALGGSDKLAGIVGADPTDPVPEDKQALIDSLDKEVGPEEQKPPAEGEEPSAGALIQQQRSAMMEDHSNEADAIQAIGGRSGDGGPPPGGGDNPPPPGGRPGAPGTPSDRSAWEAMDAAQGRYEDPSWVDKLRGTLKDIYLEMFDPDHPIRQMVNARWKGVPLDGAANPLFLRRMLETSDTSAAYAIDKGPIMLDGRKIEGGKSLRDTMDPTPKASQAKRSADYKNFIRFMTAAWAGDKIAQGKGEQAGLKQEDITKVLQEARGSDLVDRARDLMAWSNSTLLWLYHGEMLSTDQLDKITQFNQARIPGFRIMDEEKPFLGAKGADNFNPIKAFKGSERQVQPVYASLQKEAYLRMQIARSNLANLATFKAAEALGEAEARPLKQGWDFIKAIDQLKDGGIDEDVIDSIAKLAAKAGVVKKDEVPIWEDGKMFAAKFQDPDIVKTLRGYNSFTISTIGKVIAAPTRFMKGAIVRTPIFPVKIAAYDLQFQTIINPDGRAAVLQFVQGLGHTLGKSDMWDEWVRSGGAEKVFDQMGRDDAIKARIAELHDPHGLAGAFASGIWNGMKTPFEALQGWSNTIGQFQRVGAYAAARKRGLTPEKSAVISQDAAFHRPGYGGPVSSGLNQLIPFLAAHLNGLEKTSRALLGIGKTAAGTPYNPAATWALGAALITVPTLMQQFFNGDDDWYKQIPDWQKGMGLWFHVGGDPVKGEGVTTCIPYPPLVSLIFGEIPRRFGDEFLRDNPHAWDGFWKSAGMSLTPPGTETGLSIMQPIIEGLTNHSFLKDAPIIDDETRKHVGASEQYTPYTTETAKAIARFVNGTPIGAVTGQWSPAIVENYMKEWGQGYFNILKTVEQLSGVRNQGDNAAPAWKMDDWFQTWLGGMASRYPNFSGASINQFYDTATKLDQSFGSIKAAVRANDFGRFKELVDQAGPSAATYHQLRLEQELPPDVDTDRYLNYIEKKADQADDKDMETVREAMAALKAAHQYVRMVYASPKLSANDKRMILDQAAEQMSQIAQYGDDAYDRAHVGVTNSGAAAGRKAPEDIEFKPPRELQ